MEEKNKGKIIDLVLCLIIVLVIFIPTLSREWIFYDERVIYDEIYAPITKSFNELLEVIKSFGIVNNISSTNYLYTSNTVNRTSLFGLPLLLTLGLFFKKNVFLYHCLNLILHLCNTSMVFLILRRCIANRWFVVLLTSIWAIHPAHVESILLSTNIGALISYLAFFLLFYDFIKNKEKNKSLLRKIFLPICFLLPMLLNEYIVALPIIIFAYSLIENRSLAKAWNETSPYIIGLFIYLTYFLFSSYKFIQSSNLNPIILSLERIFWLSPQIFIHYLTLTFFPKALSIDQTALVHLGKSILDPYSIFCFLAFVIWLFLPFRFLTVLFFLSLLPFSQIITPTYCLCAERYLYTPIFFIVFGVAKMLNVILSRSPEHSEVASEESTNASGSFAPVRITISILTIITIILGVRAGLRANDWRNNHTLLISTIKTSPNYLYKAARYNTLADLEKEQAPEYIKKAKAYFYKAIKEFKEEKIKNPNPPLILKSYSLDYDSLIIKAAYFISFYALFDKDKDPKKYLKLFEPYLNNIDTFDPRTLEIYANLLVKDNDFTNAKRVFLYAYNKYPTSPFILVSLIRFSRDIEGDLISAKKYLTEGLKLYPYSTDILFEALRYYQRENNLLEYANYAYLYGLRTHSEFFYNEAIASYVILGRLEDAKRVKELLECHCEKR